MAARKSKGHLLVDASMHTSASTASPLRRKSILPQNPTSALSENNDEAERLERRKEIAITSTPITIPNGQEKRRSLGLGFLAQLSGPQIAERISQCIKLSAENKINIKNAFSLEIIDFMTYMIKKRDVNMSNLQVASTSLDVSTKIYGFRVDGVHTELLKLIGGLEKQEKEKSSMDEDNEEQTISEDRDAAHILKSKVKRKRHKQKIISTPDSLKGTVETAKPVPLMMWEDLQTTDMLYQITFSCHADSQYYLHQHNDVIMDTVGHESVKNTEQTCTIPKIEDISNLSLCPALPTFDFLSWTEEEQPDEPPPIENDGSGFQFDLDGSLPDDDDSARNSVNYFDIEPEEHNVDRCEKAPHEPERVVDFRKVMTSVTSAKASEYSFIQKNMISHWAGPSHWKVNNLKRLQGNSKIVETCQQAPAKKKVELVLRFDSEVKERAKEKFAPSRAIKLQPKTAKTEWTEEKLTLPPDMHYSIANAVKLYLHLLILLKDEAEDLNATHLSDIDNYDYGNENDTSNYCPNVGNHDYGESDSNNEDHEHCTVDTAGCTVLAGDNLVAAPKLTNKITIAYSLKAKKIDMRQLKKSIWKSLVSTTDKENTNIKATAEQETSNKMREKKQFTEVYKALPGMLTKSNAEALSFPISFVSLLHLANEKILKIDTLPDMSDLVVEGN